MKKLSEQRGAARESSNLFIWSAFHYFLRQSTDSYIVFSPVKYFKNVELINKKFEAGFAFNRKFFHATDSVISCILWSNIEDTKTEEWFLDCYDIDNEKLVRTIDETEKMVTLKINKVHNSISAFNDKRIFDDEKSKIVCCSDGTEKIGWNKPNFSKFNENIIAYMAANGFTPDAKHRYLTRCGYVTGIEQSFGFFVRKDNYLTKLPIWVSKLLPQDNWYDKDIYNNTSDGGELYTKDNEFLKYCLIYTCLSNQNKCLSFKGSDGTEKIGWNKPNF